MDEEVLVDPATSKLTTTLKKSPAGPLSQNNIGLWTTGHALAYQIPGGGFQTCRWYTYATTNYYLVPAIVYKLHEHSTVRSTSAEVSHWFNYQAGECQLGHQVLIWTPVQKMQCCFVPCLIMD